ncbi:MAG: MBL fold metallo-hydrolase [Proteobacteria bacterium]|nr:MBL fold metallo-hydrolase [Pseudomonadota bacterium]
MTSSSLLCNPFCNPEMLEDLEKTRVMEIAPDVWMIEGYCRYVFLLEPPSGNIFIMRDGDMVLMMDSGHHPFYRPLILDVLKKLAAQGAKDLVLVMSHGHWDHGKNNDVILEAGYESARFILPEPEFHTLNIPDHMLGDFEKVKHYYDPLSVMPDGLKLFAAWAKNFPEYNEPQYQATWKLVESLPEEYDQARTREVWESVLKNVLCPDLGPYIRDRAEPLLLRDKEKRTYGDVEVWGWPVGRFFIIHDGSQSPGHVCVYDPLHKLMITGDATLEINPPFFDCNFGACVDICEKCLSMAEQGHILLATDSHRTAQWWPRSQAVWGVTPLLPMEMQDAARGREDCVEFYRLWVEYFTTIRDETLLAHSRIGEATVAEIVEELKKSKNKHVILKLGLTLPNIPSMPGMLVARLLDETGASRRVDGDRILFTPAEKWNRLS